MKFERLIMMINKSIFKYLNEKYLDEIIRQISFFFFFYKRSFRNDDIEYFSREKHFRFETVFGSITRASSRNGKFDRKIITVTSRVS